MTRVELPVEPSIPPPGVHRAGASPGATVLSDGELRKASACLLLFSNFWVGPAIIINKDKITTNNNA